MRLVLGLGGLAALSAMVGAVVALPAPMTAQDVATGVADTASASGTDALAGGSPSASATTEPLTIVKHVKRYVYLAPGQTPTQTLVTKLPAATPRPTAKPKAPAPAPATPKPKKRIIIVTSQSGAKP
jgi:hypothetical protein